MFDVHYIWDKQIVLICTTKERKASAHEEAHHQVTHVAAKIEEDKRMMQDENDARQVREIGKRLKPLILAVVVATVVAAAQSCCCCWTAAVPDGSGGSLQLLRGL